MRLLLPLVLPVLSLAAVLLAAWPAVTYGEDAPHAYTGVNKCKMCHKKPEDGEQYRIWSEGPHAKAYETLASEKALAEGAKHGITDPQKAPECLSCHATAFAVMDDLANQKITMEEGVSCESCHGAGGDYYSKKTMTAISAGEIDGASVGLVTPDEALCLTCHKEEGNAFFQPFNFEERVKKIAHPIPPPAEGEEAAAE